MCKRGYVKPRKAKERLEYRQRVYDSLKNKRGFTKPGSKQGY